MWSIDTRWFDVAVVTSIFAIGNICFGRFEEHRPRWRRVLKVFVTLAIMLGLMSAVGRMWTYLGFLGPFGLAAIYVHGFWLPKHGVNGWTAEPRDRYLELVRRKL